MPQTVTDESTGQTMLGALFHPGHDWDEKIAPTI
jgi:hypothetical protein